jgi:hypothetical protein
LENKVIGTKVCEACGGKGKRDIMMIPAGCQASCVPGLRRYTHMNTVSGHKAVSPGYWLCDLHGPNLWTDAQRTACMNEEGILTKEQLTRGKR